MSRRRRIGAQAIGFRKPPCFSTMSSDTRRPPSSKSIATFALSWVVSTRCRRRDPKPCRVGAETGGPFRSAQTSLSRMLSPSGSEVQLDGDPPAVDRQCAVFDRVGGEFVNGHSNRHRGLGRQLDSRAIDCDPFAAIVVIGRQFLFEDFPERRGLPHRFGEKRMGVGERNDPGNESLVEIVDIGGRASRGSDDRLNRRQRVFDPVVKFSNEQRLLRLGLLALLDLILRRLIEPAILERDRGLRRKALHEPLCPFGENADHLVTKNQHAIDVAAARHDGNRHVAAHRCDWLSGSAERRRAALA